jgi:hypothetical protein
MQETEALHCGFWIVECGFTAETPGTQRKTDGYNIKDTSLLPIEKFLERKLNEIATPFGLAMIV